MKKTRVLIVDDSVLMQTMFSKILGDCSSIDVIGVASDAFDAREKIKSLNPDVITLDIEMPGMDGISFLEKIMKLRPMPVVMVSSLTQKGAHSTFRALELGAVDYVPKTSSRSFDAEKLSKDLIEKVKAAARAKVRFIEKAPVPKRLEYNSSREGKIIAVGASTGGVEALRRVIPALPENSPPMLVIQHMPEKFTKSFADRLDTQSEVTVTEAKDKELIKRGHVYIAPGNMHLQLAKGAMGYICKVKDGEHVTGHKPSVDVLFESVASLAGNQAVGVMLTGMGKDGAKGMVSMKKAGAINLGQNEDSSVVYGMPKAAFMAGAIDKQVSIDDITKEILIACSKK